MLVLRKFLRDLPAVIGLVLILAVVVLAIFGPWIAPHPADLTASHLLVRLQPPSAAHHHVSARQARAAAVRLVDDCGAADIDPTENHTLAGRQILEAAIRLLAGPLQRQRLVCLIDMDQPFHGKRQRRRGEGAPFLARQAPIVDVVGERRRNARRRESRR